MKYYNVEGYVRHKHDLEDTIKRMKRDGEIVYSDSEGTVDYTQMVDESIIKMWMPLCEALARKFATSQQAIGVMTIRDLISCEDELFKLVFLLRAFSYRISAIAAMR